MNDFTYQGNDFYCEGVPVRKIAADIGTPCYIYSRKTLERHYNVFDAAFSGVPHMTCYSVKANSSLAVLSIFAGLGAGVDVVSGGEIFRALKAGIPSRKIVYSGVGKTPAEIDYALGSDIFMFNIESPQELEQIIAAAQRAGKKARIALRINPDIDPQTHPYISTGLKENKFGVKFEEALQEYGKASRSPDIDIVGVACHIGSQITRLAPFVDALNRVKAFIGQLQDHGIEISHLDLGGGLGITYDAETPPGPADYAGAIMQEMGELPCTLILEPGRVIVGNAGALVSRVLYTKQSDVKNFIIVDAGMNDLVRPSLYDSYHAMCPVQKREGPFREADIVGPICESGDFLARGRRMPEVLPGDCVAVMSAGAYGFTMSSNYNSRPRAPEVLVDGQRYSVVRRRETYEDLIAGETVPDNLS